MQEFYRVDLVDEKPTHQIYVQTAVKGPAQIQLVGSAEKPGLSEDGEFFIFVVTGIPEVIGHSQVLRRFSATAPTVHHNTKPEIAYASLAYA